ncbi:hypothetical protein M758_5G011200 [Ceratodon purpureus]|nr:hypothetical protein M758_5G011200 [Ceratodon purpureus]
MQTGNPSLLLLTSSFLQLLCPPSLQKTLRQIDTSPSKRASSGRIPSPSSGAHTRKPLASLKPAPCVQMML